MDKRKILTGLTLSVALAVSQAQATAAISETAHSKKCDKHKDHKDEKKCGGKGSCSANK